MAGSPTYPGVYIEDGTSGSRTISGVATSITAFIGRAQRGLVDKPVLVSSFGDFTRLFGGLWGKSSLGYSVQHYFMNGGGKAIIVRVDKGGITDSIRLEKSGGTLAFELTAVSPGEWGNNLRAIVDHDTRDGKADQFNLVVQEFEPSIPESTTILPGLDSTISEEVYLDVSTDEADSRYIGKVLETSMLVRLATEPPLSRPAETGIPAADNATLAEGSGTNGSNISQAEISAPDLEAHRRGIYALENVDSFNLMVIPPLTRCNGDVDFDQIYTPALCYCEKRRAMLIMDPPVGWGSPTDLVHAARAGYYPKHQNAIIYWPRVRMQDPLRENQIEEFAPSGMMAGVIARNDGQRGIWKAPAGAEATLVGVRELSYRMTGTESDQLNQLGVNSLRNFPMIGNVSWGARTTLGADQLASEWKYLSVRRLALYIEESLYRGSQWAVFEPNDVQLWSQLRKAVGEFMQTLFRQGALQGVTPAKAYYVKCDSVTTTQADIDRGIVNIIVGFAPLKPAEFVIIKIQLLAPENS